MYLDKETFSTVIENTPLVSIDLVVKNKKGQVLLGQRLNRPAKEFWFVPGGRILKNESLAKAFKRLTFNELGSELSITDAKILGLYDHFYDDNVFTTTFSTHYVAIAYVIELNDILLESLPINVQHGGYKWFIIDSLLQDELVHINTKNYFNAFSVKE